MLGCLILGDSIADGTAAAMRAAFGGQCAVVAKTGLGSRAILERTPAGPFDSATISAGSNDPNNPRLAGNLMAIRGRVHAGKVVWILPYDRHAALVVSSVAKSWGDLVIDLSWAARRDVAHPVSYRWIARSISRAGYAGSTVAAVDDAVAAR